ncbi:hypothetical protein [Amycolatopsis minnesotensis]|uniref:hypothetical protein n=1 Tax=Amycolatopsis minnesotensis TaxID=337894 RepID=UPI0031DB9711
MPFEGYLVSLLGLSAKALLVVLGVLFLIFAAGWLTQRQQLNNGKGAPFKIKLPFYHVESGPGDDLKSPSPPPLEPPTDGAKTTATKETAEPEP